MRTGRGHSCDETALVARESRGSPREGKNRITAHRAAGPDSPPSPSSSSSPRATNGGPRPCWYGSATRESGVGWSRHESPFDGSANRTPIRGWRKVAWPPSQCAEFALEPAGQAPDDAVGSRRSLTEPCRSVPHRTPARGKHPAELPSRSRFKGGPDPGWAANGRPLSWRQRPPVTTAAAAVGHCRAQRATTGADSCRKILRTAAVVTARWTTAAPVGRCRPLSWRRLQKS
jgi:hypothetical protein